MRRRALAPVAVAALALGLAACGNGGGRDADGAPEDPEAHGGPSDGGGKGGGAVSGGGRNGANDGGGGPAEAAPDIPAPDPADFPGMDQNTTDGAEQAFRYYVAVMIWGYQTGRHAPLAALGDPYCKTCSLNVDSIKQLASADKRWSATSIEDIGTAHFDSDRYDTEVGYTFYLSAHDEPSPDTDKVTQEPRTKFIAAAAMEFTDGQWVVMSARFTPEQEGDS